MNSPKDVFWTMYVEFKYDEWFCRLFDQRANRYDWTIAIFCSAVSLASVAMWWIWQVVPWLWGTIIGVSQILQVARSFLPFPKRIAAFDYFLPKLTKLLGKIETDWLCIGDYDDRQIIERISQYKECYDDLDITYLKCAKLPLSGKVYSRVSLCAAEYCLAYFRQKYNVGGDLIGKQSRAAATESSVYHL